MGKGCEKGSFVVDCDENIMGPGKDGVGKSNYDFFSAVI